MILNKTLQSVIHIDIQPSNWGWHLFPQFRVILTYNQFGQFGVYKIKDNQQYQHVTISNPIFNIFECKHANFLISKLENYILGKATDLNKNIIIFIIDIQLQQITHCKRIISEGKTRQVNKQFQSKLYQLVDGNFKVIDYKRFPVISSYTFRTNITNFYILPFQTIEVLCLQQNTKSDFYKLPLTKNSRQMNLNNKQKSKRVYLQITRNSETAQNFGWIDSLIVYFLIHKNKKYRFLDPNLLNQNYYNHGQFILFRNEDNNLKILQFVRRQKIIRKVNNVIKVKLNDKPDPRYIVVNCKSQTNIGSLYYIYDFGTAQLIWLTNNCSVRLSGDQIIQYILGNMKIYKLQLKPQKFTQLENYKAV